MDCFEYVKIKQITPEASRTEVSNLQNNTESKWKHLCVCIAYIIYYILYCIAY